MSLKSHGHNFGLHVYLFIILLVVVHPALTVLHYRLEPRRQTINFYGLKGSSLLLIILEKKKLYGWYDVHEAFYLYCEIHGPLGAGFRNPM